MEKSHSLKSRAGSLMVEAIVAISIATIGLLGVLALLSRSIAFNKDVGQKLVATYLASEGIEVVKSIIDSNFAHARPWNDGVGSGGYEVTYDSNRLSGSVSSSGRSTTPLNYNTGDGTYGYVGGERTSFIRTVQISELSTHEIGVISIVEWLDHGVPKEVSLEDHFFNWR